MNYKESAQRLNEFNEWLELTKANLSYIVLPMRLYSDALIAWGFCRLIAGNKTKPPFILSKDEFALHNPVGCGQKNDRQLVMLSKDEFVIHDSQKVEMPLTPIRILRISKQMQNDLDKIKNKPINKK